MLSLRGRFEEVSFYYYDHTGFISYFVKLEGVLTDLTSGHNIGVEKMSGDKMAHLSFKATIDENAIILNNLDIFFPFEMALVFLRNFEF